MESSWLHKGKHEKLIVFCNGWGMDGCPFYGLASGGYDVWMLYDYRRIGGPDGQLPIESVFQDYRQIYLVGWSMGVWVGQKLFADKQHLFHRTIAINGTLCPIDDRYGIPVQVYDATLAGFSEAARLKFYKRMCREKNSLNRFLARQPQRTVQDQADELVAVREMVDCLDAGKSLYREILVSEQDFIIPTANQLNFWQHGSVTRLKGYHFPFYLWQSWDQLLDSLEFSPAVPQH